jgi:dolichol-phosphate mannosyltransferase
VGVRPRAGEALRALANAGYLSGQRLAVVTPMANEADLAEEFIKAVLAAGALFGEVRHFVVLDNASKDGTLGLLRSISESDARVVLIWAPENRSVVDAYMRGYRQALDEGFDWILEIDAGFSHQPAELEHFIAHLNDEVQCVFGTRYQTRGLVTDTPITRRLVSRGGTLLANLLLGTRLSDMTSGYQLFRADALQAILDRGVRSRAHFFQTEMKFYARRMKAMEVPITYRAPSPSLELWVLRDAAANLARLVWLRITGRAR